MITFFILKKKNSSVCVLKNKRENSDQTQPLKIGWTRSSGKEIAIENGSKSLCINFVQIQKTWLASEKWMLGFKRPIYESKNWTEIWSTTQQSAGSLSPTNLTAFWNKREGRGKGEKEIEEERARKRMEKGRKGKEKGMKERLFEEVSAETRIAKYTLTISMI